MNKLHFRVDSRLATLLSQEYSSSEKAIKELVDNAWDADAENVSIMLPRPMSDEPIVITDDGSGMTEEELRRHYLSIATDRRSKRGERTATKQRLIKGRKGIGKFAGLMAASVMNLDTHARARRSRLRLALDDLASVHDIEHLPIQHESEDCGADQHGTRITLTNLHQGLTYPDANKLRQVLLQEYGRQDDFTIAVDGKRLDIDDVSGSHTERSDTLPNAGEVRLRFAISDGKAGLRQPGITIRVGGKAIGKPGFFGLDHSENFPRKQQPARLGGGFGFANGVSGSRIAARGRHRREKGRPLLSLICSSQTSRLFSSRTCAGVKSGRIDIARTFRTLQQVPRQPGKVPGVRGSA